MRQLQTRVGRLLGCLAVASIALFVYKITYTAILTKREIDFKVVFQKQLDGIEDYTTWLTLPGQTYAGLLCLWSTFFMSDDWNFIITNADTRLACCSTENASSERSSELVVISAYFNLGKFQKGGGNNFFDTSLYLKWAKSFAYMHNPFVFYTDSLEFKKRVESLRKNLPAITNIVFLANRSEMWSFQMREATDKIFKQPNYPKHHPNTVIADYPCAQHAKYELLERTIKQEVFKRDYYAWLDIGYFREMVDAKTNLSFKLIKPPNLNNSRIAYNLIERRDMNAYPLDIFRNNIVWVGGGFFCGKKDTMLSFVLQYKRAAMFFLEEDLMNSDQQVIYSMYTSSVSERLHPRVQLQLYVPRGTGNVWFYLGYLCLKKYIPEEIKTVSNKTTIETNSSFDLNLQQPPQ